MRSTIFFLSLLVFISCSTTEIETMDSALLELSSDPSAEAIFATIAIQLKADHSEGFDRVLGLLNDLITDGKKQLHSATKVWRYTQSRCEVSSMRFKERQSYYENRQHLAADAADEAAAEAATTLDNNSFMENSSKYFVGFRAAEQTLHAAVLKALTGRAAAAKVAVANADHAVDTVKNWHVSGTAFVQSALEKVADSYLQVKNYKIEVPTSFVEMAASDAQVRTRLLEWLASLRITFFEQQTDLESELKHSQEGWSVLIGQVNELIATYGRDVVANAAQISLFTSSQKGNRETAGLFSKLSHDNARLVVANADYCKVERDSFEKVRSTIEGQIKVFVDVRNYFRTNYAKLSNFIKHKYH
jgi:hypothetical protein